MAESNETVASLDVDTPLHQQDSGDEDDDILRQTTQPAAVNTISKSSLRSRWLVLGLTCVVMTGSYYA
jgi:hypothetical protein